MRLATLILVTLALSACVEEPSKKEAKQAAKQVQAEDEAAALKSEAKNIEAAADAAAKLVEEETSDEIDAMQGNEIESADAEKSD